MHGRNGRVDRFPSLGPHSLSLFFLFLSARPTPSLALGRGSGVEEASIDVVGNDGETKSRREGKKGQTKDGSLASRFAPCNVERARATARSLLSSLSHGDSTRCDRNLHRRSASVRVIGNPIREGKGTSNAEERSAEE